jgi:hypothetical protein
MKRSRLNRFTVLPLAFLLILFASACQQDSPQVMDEGQAGAEGMEIWETSVRTAEGDLLRVDPNAEVLAILTDAGREMEFMYDGWTEIIGADEGMQGLYTGTGARVKVEYEAGFTANRATRIEILGESAQDDGEGGV